MRLRAASKEETEDVNQPHTSLPAPLGWIDDDEPLAGGNDRPDRSGGALDGGDR